MSVGNERVSTDLAGSHSNHEDDRGVNASAQRRLMPVCPAERSGQPGEKRQGRDRVDRREERREIFANLDQERRHMSERVFYPDTNDVSSTSKVVALSIARNRTRELILSASTTRSRRLSEFDSPRTN